MTSTEEPAGRRRAIAIPLTVILSILPFAMGGEVVRGFGLANIIGGLVGT